MKKIIFVIMLGLLGTGAVLAQDYVPTPVIVSKEKVRMNGKTYFSHVVLERQTLFSIAKAYGVSVTDIDRANPALKLMSEGLKKNQILLIPIADRNAPVPEQEPVGTAPETPAETTPETTPEAVQVPVSESAAKPVNPNDYFFHIVKWYEDLNAIARQYNVPKDVLMKFNGFTTDKVKKRQKIKIPSHPEYVTLPAAEEPAAETQASETPEQPQAPADTVRRDTTAAFSWFSRFIKSKDNVSIALLLPFNTSGHINENYVDFYSGALMAARDLGEKGIHIDLNVYDATGGKQPLTADRIAASDVIIGPVDTLDLVRTLAVATDRFVVSPLDPKGAALVADYRNLIHAPTSAEWQHAELINWLADEKRVEDRIILITEKGAAATPAASYLKEAGLPYSTLSYGILEGRDIVETLNGMMTREGVNRIVVACEHEAFLVDVIRNLNLLIHRKNQVVLYGPARIRSYDNTIDIENLHNLNLHVCTSYYVDYYSEPVKAFLPAYRALFRCEPTPFAYQGYDILTYFVNLISRNGDHWPNALGKRREAGLQADFLLGKVEQGGFANEAVRRIVYEPDFTIRLVR